MLSGCEELEKMRTNRVIIELTLLAALIGCIYYSTFVWLYERYIAVDSYYSHGFLVPIVSGVLIWLKKKELALVPVNYSGIGLVLICISIFIHLLSVLTGVYFLSGFSILPLILGITLFLFGGTLAKKIIFPLLFLIFMFPLPLVAINAISFPMKMLVTKAAVMILSGWFHIPLKNEGFQIFFPNATLVVENPCSGLRSLISLLALGSVFAYFLKAPMIKRLSLFALSVPIALLANIARVILLSLGVYVYGSQMAKGFFHDFTGYLMFAGSFFALLYFWRKLQCLDSK
jgi:exosortase